jgi:hypothetical protein
MASSRAFLFIQIALKRKWIAQLGAAGGALGRGRRATVWLHRYAHQRSPEAVGDCAGEPAGCGLFQERDLQVL